MISPTARVRIDGLTRVVEQVVAGIPVVGRFIVIRRDPQELKQKPDHSHDDRKCQRHDDGAQYQQRSGSEDWFDVRPDLLPEQNDGQCRQTEIRPEW